MITSSAQPTPVAPVAAATTAHAELPERVDVLIVGAGPAGCAAAITLAQAGREVLLIDQHDFPRDKTCGDGLIPDSLLALKQLGVLAAVKDLATPVKGLICHGPRGGRLEIPAELAVLPRKVLDNCLFERAQAVGARTLTRVRFVAPVKDASQRVIGARVQRNDLTQEIRANWTLLATGATTTALQACGHCTQNRPSAMALRAYVHNPSFVQENGRAIEHLHISWHKSYAPGYGWIFPCPDGIYNVGVGLYGFHETREPARWGLRGVKSAKPNLATLFKRFTDSNPMAEQLMRTGTLLGEIKGAPLRCSLKGAKAAAPGLLVTGEALGSTYALTGEGIGKAMETGMLSARALLGPNDSGADDVGIISNYERLLATLEPKFAIYEQANKINRAPWLIDLAIARGNRSPRLVQRMSRVLEEKANPARLFTWRGAWKFLTQ